MPTFCGNRTGGIGVILLLATTGSACLAAPWNPDDTAPFERDVAQAADHARSIGCETSSCKAIIAIDEVVRGEIKKYENVNDGALYSDKAARTAARTLNAALLDHPALFAPVCQMSARLLSRFHNGPDVPDIAVPVQLLIESVDMDIRDHGHCAHDLITALPNDKANTKIRFGAHALCVNDDNNHRRTRAACDTLIPGLTDPALAP